ncbi:LysM peptidoglycan-binding domain-containing protein [Streptomyces sp. NPDC086182]|uniref:LysM peptidoglycan-binding domain-containing protein n=1 Tax=Streptomyces sp. NPDC086182 TaxID=3155058 RepID=UPI00341F5892
MAQRTRAPLRTLAVVMRSLLLLAVLVATVVGPPAVLLLFGHQPTSLPGADALTQPDDGTLFFTVLTCIGWIAWACFTFSVLVESVAVLRRRAAPRLPGLSGMQSLASFLVGGIVLLAPAAATAAAVPNVAVAQHVDASSTHTMTKAVSPTPGRTAPITHTVTSPTESPWALAETYLGSGQRWKDIAALNPDIPGLASGDSYLPRGAVITLPAEAALPVPDSAVSTGLSEAAAAGPHTQLAESVDQSGAREHRVVPGDTLWGIAEEELGDGSRYTALFEATHGKAQPHGLPRVSDADLILPGQEITVPGAEDAEPPSASGPHEDESAHPPGETPDDEHGQNPDRESSGQNAPSTPTHNSQTPSASPTGTAAPSHREAAESPAVAAGEHEDAGSSVVLVGLAASGMFAAAVLITLGNRRLLQRRALRRGHRIVMPTGRAAITEMELRSVDASVELQLLDAMLRTTALHLADNDGVLPELLAIRLGADGALLYLAEPMAPVAPFTTADGAASTAWWCSATTDLLFDSPRLREIDPPYPGLLALGSGDDESIVLVDLEQVGAIHLIGDRRQEVLRMAAVTLALSPLGGQMELAVAGADTVPGLVTLDQQRVTPYLDLTAALTALTVHHDEQNLVLAEFGSDGLAAARLEGDVEELWPLVLLADLDACPDPGSVSQGWDLLGDVPPAALATLTSGADVPDAPEDVWVVDTNAAYVTVPGTDVQCSLPGCSVDEYADVLELVVTSDQPIQKDTLSSQTSEAQSGVAGDVSTFVPDAQTDTGVLLVKSVKASSSATDPGSLPFVQQTLSPEADGPGLSEPTDSSPAHSRAPRACTDHSAPRLNTPDRALVEAAHSAEAWLEESDDDLLSEPVLDPAGLVSQAARPIPRVSVRLPRDSDAPRSATPAPDSALNGPLVRVLGPVALEGARGEILSNRKTAALELVAWLVLHEGANAHQIDDVLAPFGRISRDTRNSRIRDVRKWLGQSAEGNLYMPHLATQADKQFRLDDVACDWLTFQRLADDHSGDVVAREQRLRAALELVAGRPFSGIPARRYVWAESLIQDIIKRIVQVADEFAEQRLRSGDGRGALWAANSGLHVAREVEQLWRHRFRAHALLGQDDELEKAIQALEGLLLEIGCSMEEETSETVRLLQVARR